MLTKSQIPNKTNPATPKVVILGVILALGLAANGCLVRENDSGEPVADVAMEPESTEREADPGKRDPDLFPTGKLIFEQAVGKQAPDFSLESIDGKTFRLSDHKGKNVILFFNEGSMCYPLCWNQMAAFGKDERFNGEEIIAFSIVPDPKSEWEKIAKKAPGFANARILFDTTGVVSLAYDVLSLESSMHPGSRPGHTYFVIDKEGIVRFAFDDPSMAIRNDMLILELSKLRGE